MGAGGSDERTAMGLKRRLEEGASLLRTAGKEKEADEEKKTCEGKDVARIFLRVPGAGRCAVVVG